MTFQNAQFKNSGNDEGDVLNFFNDTLRNLIQKTHQTDPGYYGQGIYATDNPYYALMYSNGFHELGINQKAYIICCRSIYNETKIVNISDIKEYYGKPIKPDIKNAFGINHAFVGDSTKPYPFLPIDK